MKTGTDQLHARSPLGARLVEELRGRSFGLLAHPASVTRDFSHVAEVLHQLGLRPRVVFGPEHGYGGEAQDMIGVEDSRDAYGVPIRSLYGERFEDLSPRAEDLRGLDLVLVDLADVGSRYYTFVWTAVLVARACAAAGVRVIVLDRPNPLGGEVLEGRLVEPDFRSFVGLEPLPVRHGLTPGEVVAWRAEAEGLPAGAVSVVRCDGWDRASLAPAWDRPFVMTSPNMPTFDTALVYPGGCLLEATNLSEGRGTTRPFEVWGAPFVDGVRLAREVPIEGAILRPLVFEPTFHKHGRTLCGGVQVHVTDASRFRAYDAYLRLMASVFRARGGFQWRTEEYEFVTDRPAIDLLTGGPEYRTAVEADRSLEPVLAAEREGARRFSAARSRWFLYPRGPAQVE